MITFRVRDVQVSMVLASGHRAKFLEPSSLHTT